MTLPRIVLLFTLLAAVLGLAACGSSNSRESDKSQGFSAQGASQSATDPQPDPAQPLSPTIVKAQDGKIDIRIESAHFVQNHLQVAAGDSVTIRIMNADSQPHNMRIAGPDGQYETDDDALSQPAVIDGSATGELTFAPAVAGKYTWRCDFHPGSMGGQIQVIAH